MQELIQTVCDALQEFAGVNKRTVKLRKKTFVELNGILIPGRECKYALKNIDPEIDGDTFIVGQVREGVLARISGEMNNSRKCVVKRIHTNA